MTQRSVENLFRRQAVESLSRQAPGRPICLMPRPWAWLSLFVCVIFVAALMFVATGEYARKERAVGWLVASNGVVRVSSSAAAIVREVAVAAGARVERGDSLIYLSRDTRLPAGESTSDLVLNELQLELAELATQLELTDEQLRQEQTSYEKQLSGFERERELLQAGLDAQTERVALSGQKLQRLEALVGDGAISAWDVILQKERVSELEQEQLRLQQDLARHQRERRSLQARFDNLPIMIKMQRSSLMARRRQLQQEVAQHESRRLSVLSSPRAGVVSSIQINAGDAAAPGQLLMTVLPSNAVLSAEVYVPSRAAGFIQPGQDVRLAFAAFPPQKFGTFSGHVRRISDFVLLPGDIPQTFSIREATYRVEIVIDDAETLSKTKSAVLRPGMLLTAEIILEDRSMLDWLLEPLRLYRRADG